MRRIGVKTIILVSFLVLLVAARLCLPYVAKHFINKTLQNDIEGYTGSIADVDIHLIRGAYGIDSLKLLKKNGKVPVPFISVAKIDFAIEWQALFDGSLVGQVITEQPRINFVDGPTEAQTQTGEENNWQQTVKDLFPLRINKLVIRDGEVHFQNLHSTPKVDIFLNQINLVARNLTNSEEISKTLVSSIDGESKILNEGKLIIHLDMNPLQEKPPFNMDVSVEGVQLTKLNDFFRAYANIDMEKGEFSLFSEMAGNQGKFNGYIKPLFKDIKILDIKEDKNKPLRLIWEAGIGLVSTIFKNHSKDQVATKIPLSGDLNDPKVDVTTTIINVVKNAFVKAINPELDGTIDMGKMSDTEKQLKAEAKDASKEKRKESKKEKREEKKEERKEKREERKKEREERLAEDKKE
jgi:hypothetical protein